jgi:probable F420-dependent oxidoreductase
MKLGLFGINVGACGEPDTMLEVTTTAEKLGFESVWTGEHVVLPDPQVPPSPSPPLVSMTHPSTALAYIAAATTTLKLGTGITLLAQRNPVVLAKEMASLDYLSRGRLIFGIGAGYLKAEFDALGVNFAERGARTDEYIKAMRELWTADQPTFAGRFVRFGGIQSRPRPHRAGGPPIVVGGASAAALKRAVTACEGWYGFAMDFDTATRAIDGLREVAKKHPRPAALGQLEISITPRMATGKADLARWREIGVDRLILLQRGADKAALLDNVKTVAATLL